MTRRAYTMQRRAEAVRETRDRIVAATMEVHAEQGILAARWEDIAKRAQVSLATVYRHFASVDELVAACGEPSLAALDPPAPEAAGELLDGAATAEERVERAVAILCAVYERGAAIVEEVRRDADKLPALRTAHERIDGGRLALVAAALPDAPEAQRRVAEALTDVRVWLSLADAGVGVDGIRATLTTAILRQGACT